MLQRVKELSLRTRDFSRTTFRPRHRVVARAFAEALFTHDAPIADARLDAFVDDLDDFISHASKALRFALRTMLDIVRFVPLVLLRSATPFEELPLADRTRLLEAMERSRFTPFVLMFVAYKTVMAMTYFEDDGELSSIGYPGPSRERYKVALPLHERRRDDLVPSSAPPLPTAPAAPSPSPARGEASRGAT